MERNVISTDRAPAAIGPYSQGVAWGNTVFCSGQIPLDPATGKLINGDIGTQVRRVLDNLEAVLESGGSGLDRILRLDVYLTDLSAFPVVNGILADVFTGEPPARVTVEVSGLPLGAMVEMAAIAAACELDT